MHVSTDIAVIVVTVPDLREKLALALAALEDRVTSLYKKRAETISLQVGLLQEDPQSAEQSADVELIDGAISEMRETMAEISRFSTMLDMHVEFTLPVSAEYLDEILTLADEITPVDAAAA